MQIPIYATEGTGKFLQEHGFEVTTLPWDMDQILGLIRERQVDLVLNCPKNFKATELSRGSMIRQTASQLGCALLTNMEKIIVFIKALKYHESANQLDLLSLPPYRHEL